MMNYEAREQWIRAKLVGRNYEHAKNGDSPNSIISDIDPNEFNPLGDNWEMEIYELEPGVFSIDIFEKSTEREFTFYVYLKK